MKTIPLLLLPLAFAGLVQAQQYVEISGTIQSTARATHRCKPIEETKTCSFVCTLGPNEWRMENDCETFEKWHYDGTNVYNSLSGRDAEHPELRPNLTVNIYPSVDGLPLGDTYVVVPWLAFCSGDYLSKPGRRIPLPVGPSLKHTRDRFAYTDKTEVFNNATGLPKKMELFTSKAFYIASENDFDREYFMGNRYSAWVKRTAETLKDGEVMFHYAVTETTNFQGTVYPAKCEFFQNPRAYEQNGDWQESGTLQVTSMRAASKPKNLFDPKHYQETVVDWRFRDEVNHLEALIYTTTNDSTPSTTDPQVQNKLGERLAQMRKAAKNTKPSSQTTR